MTAEWIHQAGLFLGQRLHAAHLSNPRGHFEDMEVVALHDRLLAQHGTTWQFCGEVPLDLDQAERDEIAALASARCAAHASWGFKDPRVCLFLTEWLAALEDVSLLVVYRHWLQCLDSLFVRHANELCLRHPEAGGLHLQLFKDPALGLKCWLAHNRRLLDAIGRRRERCLIVSHHALVHGFPLIDQVRDRLGFALNATAAPLERKLLRESKGIANPNWISPALFRELEETWRSLQHASAAPAPDFEGGVVDVQSASASRARIESQLAEAFPPPIRAEQPARAGPSAKTSSASDCAKEAQRLLRLGDARVALEWAERAVQLEPLSAEHFARLGSICLAINDYRRALELDPKAPYTRLAMAELARERGELDAALDGVNILLAGHAAFRPGLLLRAQLLLERGDALEAVSAHREVLQTTLEPTLFRSRLDGYLSQIGTDRAREIFLDVIARQLAWFLNRAGTRIGRQA
jgi:tetratricopeptide (TPR) repeat protein